MILYDLIPVYCDLKQINPENIKKYLISHNWKCTHTYPDGVSTLWEKGTSTVRHIPDQELYSDYFFILATTLTTIAHTDKICLNNLIETIEPDIIVGIGYTEIKVNSEKNRM
jgi:hypothetical protein